MKYIPTLAIALLFTLAFTVPCHAKIPPKARQVLYKAQMFMDKEQYLKAASIIEQYMESSNEGIAPQVFLTLGAAQHQAGNEEQAYEAFKKGLKVHPNNPHLCRNAAVASYNLKLYSKAGRLLEKTCALQESADPEILYQAASNYYQDKAFKDSARVLLELLDNTEKARREWIQLAVHALLEDRQSKKAKSMLLEYLESTPDDAAYWKLLAKMYLEKEQYSKAAAALEITYRLNTPSIQELENLASIYKFKEAPLLAAQTLIRAYGSSMNHKQALKVAALYASAGRINKALDYMDRYSNNKSTILKKGILLFRARNFSDAEKVLLQVLDTEDAGEAHLYIALCAWEQKDWKKAKHELERISHGYFKKRASGYLTVLKDIETARIEAGKLH